MSRRTGLLILAGITGAVAIAFIANISFQRQDTVVTAPTAETNEEVVPVGTATVKLYFPGYNGRLHSVEHLIGQSEDVEHSVLQVVEALLAGSQQDHLVPLFEIEDLYAEVLLTPNAEIFLNLISSDYTSPPEMGTHQEMLTVFSLVDSIILNFPGIQGVLLLWNGEQNKTFAGHIDTTQPLTSDSSLLADSSE